MAQLVEVRNKRPYPVRVHVLENDETYRCAASPGTVEVPASVAKSLLAQDENWSSVKKSDKEGED